MLPGSPLLWLALVGWLAAGGTFVVQEFQKGRQWKVAYDKGVDAGKGLAATAALSAATDTARAEREAEVVVSPVPADHAALVARCNKDRACRDRGKF
jgi:hypothetical protein